MTALDLRGRFAAPNGRLRLLLIAAAIALPWLAGVAVPHASVTAVAAGIGAVAVVILLGRRPQVIALALVFFTSTIFTIEYIPKLQISEQWGVFVTEVLLAAYIAYRGLRLLLLRDQSYRVGAVEVALGIFLLLILVSTYSAVSAGRVDFGTARGYARRYLMYVSFFVLIGTIRDERSYRRVFDVVQVFAAITSILTVAQLLVGWDHRLFFGNQLEYIQGNPGDIYMRVRPPGFYLTCALFVPSIALLLTGTGARRQFQAVVLVLYSAAILISLERTIWVALVLGVVIYLLLSSGRMRLRTLRATLAAVAIMALVTAGLARLVPAFGPTALERIVTSGSESDVNTRERLVEYQLAFRQIAHEPIFGGGPGIDYGNVAYNVVGDTYELGSRPYTHNSYINLLLYFGVAGLAAYTAFITAALAPAASLLHRDTNPDRRNLAAATVAGVCVVLISAFGFAVLDFVMILPLLLLLAGLAAMQRSERAERNAPDQAPVVTTPHLVAIQ